MTKKTHTAEQPAAGTAVPEKDITAIPAHKHTYITRHGGSVVIDVSSVDVQANAVVAHTLNTTEGSNHDD